METTDLMSITDMEIRMVYRPDWVDAYSTTKIKGGFIHSADHRDEIIVWDEDRTEPVDPPDAPVPFGVRPAGAMGGDGG